MAAGVGAYIAALRELSFVRDVSLEKEETAPSDGRVDGVLRIRTPTSSERVYLEVKSSNMSREMASQVVALARDVHPLLVLAPVIGAGIGEFLADNGVCYLDLRGNCHIDLNGRYIASIQSRRSPSPGAPAGLRTPSYQVLFGLLTEPALISATVRAVATVAGVSRQPVATVRALLVDLELVLRGPKGYAWAPQGRRKALDLWLAGYATSVRPSLLVGSYRTPDANPEELERRIGPLLDAAGNWKWGGGAASSRMTGYFHGTKTVVHIDDPPADLARTLRAVPARDGPLVLLRAPGPKGLAGATPDTAHPLLVYSELLTDGGERARDAAQELAERYAAGGEW